MQRFPERLATNQSLLVVIELLLVFMKNEHEQLDIVHEQALRFRIAISLEQIHEDLRCLTIQTWKK